MKRCAAAVLSLPVDSPGVDNEQVQAETQPNASFPPRPTAQHGIIGQDQERIVTKVRVRPGSQLVVPSVAGAGQASGIVGASSLSASRKHDYELAVGMVFSLGLARRLMDRYPEKRTRPTYSFCSLACARGRCPCRSCPGRTFE
jgi:hypothetical protein